MKIIDRLSHEEGNIITILKHKDGRHIILIDGCDGYYKVLLNKQELALFIKELTQLHNGLDDWTENYE